jgi:hypothetical protein
MHSHVEPSTRGYRGILLVTVVLGVVVGVVVSVAAVLVAIGRGSDRPIPRLTDGPDPVGGLGLTVSPDGRHFVDEAGRPFFWLADTAWAMPLRLDRDEVLDYLDARSAQGFNVVQTVAIFNQAGGPGPNRYGDSPFSDELAGIAVTEGADPGDAQQYDYWDHLDFVVAAAGARGMRVALVPIWGDDQAGTVVTEDNADDYGIFLGARYADDQVIWVMGGDAAADGVEDVWRELARGIAIGATGSEDYGTTLMTYHPLGDQGSGAWFQDDQWLDFNMVQGGHCLRYNVRRDLLDETYAATPTKPVLDGEPIYSAHPYCWKPEDGYSTPLDVRRDAYWSAFAGAAGHTYGHHSVWQFLGTGQPATLGAQGDWRSALDDEAAGQMKHLATLMESRHWWTLVPDEDMVTSGVGDGPSRLQAIRAADGIYAMVYSPDGAPFDVDLSVLTGDTVGLSWFDPRTGATLDVGAASAQTATMQPPSAEDWVLVADAHGP